MKQMQILNILLSSYAKYMKVAKIWGAGVLGIWGEWLLIFRELGSTGNYFRAAREHAHNFGD